MDSIEHLYKNNSHSFQVTSSLPTFTHNKQLHKAEQSSRAEDQDLKMKPSGLGPKNIYMEIGPKKTLIMIILYFIFELVKN